MKSQFLRLLEDERERAHAEFNKNIRENIFSKMFTEEYGTSKVCFKVTDSHKVTGKIEYIITPYFNSEGISYDDKVAVITEVFPRIKPYRKNDVVSWEVPFESCSVTRVCLKLDE